MFQSFSGNSRRTRQINLSGQNTNPFAASSWAPNASGTKKTVQNAQAERQQRQQERERLNGAKKIQRVWRGHMVRKTVANEQRLSWDETDGVMERDASQVLTLLPAEMRLLLEFFSPRQPDDVRRLFVFAGRVLRNENRKVLTGEAMRPRLLRLLGIIIDALRTLPEKYIETLLQLLAASTDACSNSLSSISQKYYRTLSYVVTTNPPASPGGPLLEAIVQPLVRNVDAENDLIYNHFAFEFLTTPNVVELMGGSKILSSRLDFKKLCNTLTVALSTSPLSTLKPNSRLWLLAHIIRLHRDQGRDAEERSYLRVSSLLVSSLASEIVSRINPQSPESAEDEDEMMADRPSPLPPYVHEELTSLVNQESISNLLSAFVAASDRGKDHSASNQDATLIASYALTLLRIFPKQGDEIRMWLYLGSMKVSGSQTEVPAIRVFWQAMLSTKIFSAISSDPGAALTILRRQTKSNAIDSTQVSQAKSQDWQTILLFLELYTFVLRFTDDEEFLGTSRNEFSGDSKKPLSRISESALPLQDVRLLSLFLKNLAFTMYYNAADISESNETSQASLIGYFGMSSVPIASQAASASSAAEKQGLEHGDDFDGVPGLTTTYVRGIVLSVMRMLYERDSRRRFLPKDHWLMTSRFDMGGFIPAVVMEEERQLQVNAGEVDDDDDDEDVNYDSGIIGMHRGRYAAQLENLRRRQHKAARKKVLAAVGPRLEILQNMPFVIPFETRVQIFRHFIHLDQSRRRGGHTDPDNWRMSVMASGPLHGPAQGLSGRDMLARHHGKISRDRLFDDALENFYELGDGLKEPIQITFVDKFNTVEAGIDGGGVTKEFLTSVTNEAFHNRNYDALFVSNDQNLLYPNPSLMDARKDFLREAHVAEGSAAWNEAIRDLLQRYEFLGRIVGKCLYEGILIDINFASFFLLKWASTGDSERAYKANINDLRDLDESLYQGLLKLKNYPGDVEDFSLDFTIVDTVSEGKTITRSLDGEDGSRTVTNELRPLYIYYVARHRLLIQPYHQTQAFLRGLNAIIKPSWLSMFNQSELQRLIGGDSSSINVADLRANTIYGGVYVIGDDGLEHPSVQHFWDVMEELNDEDRRKVLKYVTSTPRAPLLGFEALQPRFSIRDGGGDETRLPSTSTCVNLLKLPRYSSKELCKEKLLYAVNAGAGFDLS